MPLHSSDPITSIPERVYQRLMHNADRDEVTGCLISRYSTGSHGYSQIGWNAGGRVRMILGHRARWIHDVGPIAEGMTIDHKQSGCHRKCIELSHLREIPNLENARRNQGRDWPAGAICWRGHGPESLTPIMRRKGPGMTCIECVRISKRAYAERKRNT